MSIALIVLIVLLVLLVLYAVVTFNRIVRLRNQSEEAFSDIDVQLKRRHDLIPNLVETVKGYAAHERETFETVTAARSKRSPRTAPRPRRRRRTSYRRAAPAVRGRRELPRPEGEPELPRAAERAHRHRGQDPGVAALLQHDRARPEHQGPAVPVEHHRGLRERQGARVLRAGGSGGPRCSDRVVRYRARLGALVVRADRIQQAEVAGAAGRLPGPLRRAGLHPVAVVRGGRAGDRASRSRSSC